MVVVSGSWVKNAAPYMQVNKDVAPENNENMGAQAVLICRPNSLHFQERILSLDQPVEVSRAVGRAKPTSTNAIFDCKVLSKHHALLWYENGKFYIQDTKSSNGTFVNNNRLSPEVHEIHSGDIIQFGVDVVECNRKGITHGCIIAIVRLYLPDGVMVKANPCIADEETHVPLGDLYKLNQYLQEANKREQCLESKLDVLQHVVEETKRSTEESWQAYVGEEKLLSRLSALESQLQHAKSNWSEDKFKEEIAKLRENNEKYQEAAKEALEKVHAEKQQAVVLAMEQERAKISAEQDALIVRDQLNGAQLEIQEIVQKLREIQTKAEEEKSEYEKQIRELEKKRDMEKEEAKIIDLEFSKKHNFSGHIEQRPNLIFGENDLKAKEEIIAENEMSELNKSNSNGYDDNHISLTVAPVEKARDEEKTEDLEYESITKHDDEEGEGNKEGGKRVSFNMLEGGQANTEESRNRLKNSESPAQETQSDTTDFEGDHVDSKTLKYQYQSAQREQFELRRKIAILEKNSDTNQTKICELNKALNEEKELSGSRLVICDKLKEELKDLEDKWKESNIENIKLLDRVNELVITLEKKTEGIENENENVQTNLQDTSCSETNENEADVQREMQNEIQTIQPNKVEDLSDSVKQILSTSNTSMVSSEELTNIEEELVLFKEKYAQSCEDKVKLQRDLLKLRLQYNMVCDNMYNKYFWYIGPLVFIVIYLLIREWIS